MEVKSLHLAHFGLPWILFCIFFGLHIVYILWNQQSYVVKLSQNNVAINMFKTLDALKCFLYKNIWLWLDYVYTKFDKSLHVSRKISLHKVYIV